MALDLSNPYIAVALALTYPGELIEDAADEEDVLFVILEMGLN